MNIPVIDPKWRTPTVVALCQSMREAQDFSALPILADALQDCDCDNAELLEELRKNEGCYARRSALAACIMSEKTQEAVEWIESYQNDYDTPPYEPLVNAATGHHDDNKDADDGYCGSEIYNGYLHFSGRDAHGDIQPEFWDQLELATGMKIVNRPSSFSCSC